MLDQRSTLGPRWLKWIVIHKTLATLWPAKTLKFEMIDKALEMAVDLPFLEVVCST